MAITKVADLHAQDITVNCPYCHRAANNPSDGSKFWRIVEDKLQASQKFKCSECGEQFSLPKHVPSRKLW